MSLLQQSSVDRATLLPLMQEVSFSFRFPLPRYPPPACHRAISHITRSRASPFPSRCTSAPSSVIPLLPLFLSLPPSYPSSSLFLPLPPSSSLWGFHVCSFPFRPFSPPLFATPRLLPPWVRFSRAIRGLTQGKGAGQVVDMLKECGSGAKEVEMYAAQGALFVHARVRML